MKAFHFRLDPALRWRATQLQLERERVSRAAGQVAAIQTELAAIHTGLRSGSSELVAAGSTAFESWAAWVDRCRRRIQSLEEQLKKARLALALQTQTMVKAHQQLRVLENLKRGDQSDWDRDLGRETEALAGEAFLAKLTRNSRTRDKTGQGYIS
jgi:predicted trehalose synthase